MSKPQVIDYRQPSAIRQSHERLDALARGTQVPRRELDNSSPRSDARYRLSPIQVSFSNGAAPLPKSSSSELLARTAAWSPPLRRTRSFFLEQSGFRRQGRSQEFTTVSEPWATPVSLGRILELGQEFGRCFPGIVVDDFSVHLLPFFTLTSF